MTAVVIRPIKNIRDSAVRKELTWLMLIKQSTLPEGPEDESLFWFLMASVVMPERRKDLSMVMAGAPADLPEVKSWFLLGDPWRVA